jgi:hypothetical protein
MMKLKFLPLIVGVIAAAAISATPLTAFAQDTAPQPETTTTRIRLSDQQQAQFQQLEANAITAIENLLNAEQKTQFAQARQNRQGLNAIQGLTEEQKQGIVAVIENLNNEIGKLLTPEQIQQIEQSQSN